MVLILYQTHMVHLVLGMCFYCEGGQEGEDKWVEGENDELDFLEIYP